jgi:hypothetical protein
LVLRHQLEILSRKKGKPRFHSKDKVLLRLEPTASARPLALPCGAARDRAEMAPSTRHRPGATVGEKESRQAFHPEAAQGARCPSCARESALGISTHQGRAQETGPYPPRDHDPRHPQALRHRPFPAARRSELVGVLARPGGRHRGGRLSPSPRCGDASWMCCSSSSCPLARCMSPGAPQILMAPGSPSRRGTSVFISTVVGSRSDS